MDLGSPVCCLDQPSPQIKEKLASGPMCVYNNNYICLVSKATAHNNYATKGRSALFDFISLKNGKDTMKSQTAKDTIKMSKYARISASLIAF